jgi:thiosulfate/3-mercaptopyruvate sulfurtransferase
MRKMTVAITEKSRFNSSAIIFSFLVLLAVTVHAHGWGEFGSHLRGAACSSSDDTMTAAEDTWQPGQLIGPEQLSSILSSAGTEKPVILCVAPNVLFRAGHIPGAKRIGPASQPESLENLRAQAQSIARNKEIVVYCGCCPWQNCPNVRPAFVELQKMGFTKIKVLHILTNFKQDWTDKGYPVVRGE